MIEQLVKGTVVNYLTVLDDSTSFYSFKNKHGKIVRRYTRKCLCSCGKITYQLDWQLRKGIIYSCGHYQLEGNIERAYITAIKGMKQSAEIRNIKWKLTDAQALDLIKQLCFYCGSLPDRSFKLGHNRDRDSEEKYTGIDRLNSNKPYSVLNCVPCCTECNLGKHIQSLDQFLSHVKRIYEYIGLNHLNENFSQAI